MATSLVSFFVSGQLCSASALIVAECVRTVDQRGSSSCGCLGFIKGQPAFGANAGLSCRSLSSRVAAIFASKHRSAVLESDDGVEDDDDDYADDEATEFTDMEEWMRAKPPGFGRKQYDTSLEDRLLAEMEAEKKARAALASKKKGKKIPKAAEKKDAPPQGVEVYVGDLPRKRNVDRDLRAAFRAAQGLLHVRPIVDGNEKTREPVCKGLAFLTFASDREAKDFIQRYNGEVVKFGKTTKKVVCELAAVNSPFKKQVSQMQGTAVPPLQVRDSMRSSPSAGASPSSHMEVEHRGKKDVSAVESNSSNRPSVVNVDNLEGQDEEVDSLEVSEDELLALEQEVWAELEDEDDFELERELEADEEEEEGLASSMNVENARGHHTGNELAQDRQELGRIDVHASDPIDVRKIENDFVGDHEVEDTDMESAGSIGGQGFGSIPDSAAEAGAEGDKDKRIQELESELKELQFRLEERQTKAKAGEHASKSDEKIEALERRLLARANKMEKKSKTSNAATAPKKQSSKVKSVSSRKPNLPKLGGASRLKKKEKQLYTGVLSKYSTSAKEMAM